jgi:hypothetical protein
MRLINYPFWERKEFKRNKRMVLFVPFFSRKIRILVGSFLVQKKIKIVWGPFWLNIAMNFDLLHFTFLGKKIKENNHMAQ